MDKVIVSIGPAIVLTVLLAFFGGCGENVEDDYSTLPAFERAEFFGDNSEDLQPARLKLFKDTLYISYVGKPRIDLFTTDLERIRTIPLTDPEPVFPTEFDISDSLIFVTDHARHMIAVYERDGTYFDSFDALPDGKTGLSPFALAYFGGVLYASDIHMGKVLAVSMTDAPDITEKGELILTIPKDTTATIKFPSTVMITFDGRLLAGEAETGEIKVYTCDGRYIYSFEKPQTERVIAPMGIAMDNVIDPSMQDSSSFDPSGIRRHGRYHVVDANNSIVHMFNPFGKFIASYPTDSSLSKPSDIAIDRRHKMIYISDPHQQQIRVYRY